TSGCGYSTGSTGSGSTPRRGAQILTSRSSGPRRRLSRSSSTTRSGSSSQRPCRGRARGLADDDDPRPPASGRARPHDVDARPLALPLRLLRRPGLSRPDPRPLEARVTDRLAYRPAEVAELLGVSRDTI